MANFIQALIQGVAMGSLYGLIAIGYVLIYNAWGILNFAQGDMVMVGAFAVYVSHMRLGLPMWLAIPVALLICMLIGFLIEGVGEDALAGFLMNRPVTGVLLSGLVGLIPNCAASVMITELYLKGILGAGQMMAGLLVGAGVGLLVLFRAHRNLKKNLQIAAILYMSGVIWGMIIEALKITF